MRTRPGKSDPKVALESRWISFAQSLRSSGVRRVREAVGQPVDDRKPGVHLERETAVRCRDEGLPADPERLRDELPLLLAVADVLDDGIREDDVERAVEERERERVTLNVADSRIALAKPKSVVQAECRDPLRPRVELLEEVQRRAVVALVEAELVRADVQHGRLLGGLELVEEELELALSGAHRDGIRESHGPASGP